jgi:hypothetical protein
MTNNTAEHQPSTINHQPSRFAWVKSIPDYMQYFSSDQKLIIELIGIDNYLILHDSFSAAGTVYFSTNPNPDQLKVKELIGEGNYIKMLTQFSNSEMYFNSIIALKKAWVKSHRHINYKDAARTVGVRLMTIYRWRNE